MIDIKCKLCNEKVILQVESEEGLKSSIVKALLDVPCSKCVPVEEYVKFFTETTSGEPN